MGIKMNNLVNTISLAIDLAQSNSNFSKEIIEQVSSIDFSPNKLNAHTRRTAYIAMRIGLMLNLTERELQELYISSKIHDIGAIEYLTFSNYSTDFIKKHCIKGAQILNEFPHFKNISDIILYHHENINGSGPFSLTSEDIPLLSKILRLSDMLEVLYEENTSLFSQKNKIIEKAMDFSGIIFPKDIVNAFLKVSSTDSFWFDLENVNSIDLILGQYTPDLNITLSLDEFEEAAIIFSKIVDSRSPFTARHSKGIANIAFIVSKYLGFDEEKCKKMKIAGLLHDVGKITIPGSILDKPSSLNASEFYTIKSHVYFTKILLDCMQNIEDITEWASNHHERLDGKGYPRGLDAKNLSPESRIMAICDIYQALTEDRPYRTGLQHKEALKILRELAEKNAIDPFYVEKLNEAILNTI